jgi:hypothetical protein
MNIFVYLIMRIVIVEPTWSGLIHCPGNAGLLSIVSRAFPNAQIDYVGEISQCDHVTELLDPQLRHRVSCQNWSVWQDSPGIWSDQLKRRNNFDLIHSTSKSADIILMASATATALNEVVSRGLASKTYACLHGNANDFFGWRSRNPFRRYFDFTSASQRFIKAGGKFLVMEQRIADLLVERLPFFKNSVACLPHPLIASETRPKEALKPFGQPIRIGFAGNASLPKGFSEFSDLAKRLRTALPGNFEFYAIGFLPEESRHIDQSMFATKATERRLERSEFNALLENIDFMFQWHADAYYELSASGVVYDAINYGIPMIARYGSEIKSLQDSGRAIGLSATSLENVVASLIEEVVGAAVDGARRHDVVA